MPSATPPIRSIDSDIYDAIIIGGGPSALAVAARLREPLPSALYTDVEHQRFHWLKKHGSHIRTRDHSSLKPRDTARPFGNDLRLLVLDRSGDEFLSAWKAHFKAFGISQLRSPMFFHPDPKDVDSLLAYACLNGRDGELKEIGGVVGKERSKHQEKRKRSRLLPKNDVNERERQDYFTPSSMLFIDFCQEVISRYDLQSIIHKADVTSVEYARLHAKGTTLSSDAGFCIDTASSGTFGARAVILAVGVGSNPNIPPYLSPQSTEAGWCHSSSLKDHTFLSKTMDEKIKSQERTHVVVIGGGLTSAQIVDLAIGKGVHKVFLICRSHIKLKDFDFPLSWIGKFKNLNRASFWNEEDLLERSRIIQEARNGGSITPSYWHKLQKHVSAGNLVILPCTEISFASYSETQRQWTLRLSSNATQHQSLLPPVDYVYAATGTRPCITSLPFLRPILKSHPIEICDDSLPCLTDDLQWDNDLPLFVVGGYSALQVGPGAFNLEGGREGANRVALRVVDILGSAQKADCCHESVAGYTNQCDGGRYDVLQVEGVEQ